MVRCRVPWARRAQRICRKRYAAGNLLSAVAYFLLGRFGWRTLFVIGGCAGAAALFVRFGIKESEIWQKNKAESWSHLGRGIASSWKIWIYLTLLMAMMNLSSHGTQDRSPPS